MWKSSFRVLRLGSDICSSQYSLRLIYLEKDIFAFLPEFVVKPFDSSWAWRSLDRAKLLHQQGEELKLTSRKWKKYWIQEENSYARLI